MLKVTIILAILAIVSYVVFKYLVESMSLIEKIMDERYNDAPTRCIIAFWVFVLLSVATLVCLIITIITW